jgi:hypothetical protein
MKQLSWQLFSCAIAAACRFSVYTINSHQPSAPGTFARVSNAALGSLLNKEGKRVMAGNSRRKALAWAGLAGVLMHRLSYQFSAQPAAAAASSAVVFHPRVKHTLVATCAREGGALQLAEFEIAQAAAVNA